MKAISYCGGCGYEAEDHTDHKPQEQDCSRCGTQLITSGRLDALATVYHREVAARRRAEAPLRVSIGERIRG